MEETAARAILPVVADDGTVILWDTATGKPVRRFNGHRAKAMALAASPDGRYLASGSWDRTVRIWETDTGASIRTIRHPTDITGW